MKPMDYNELPKYLKIGSWQIEQSHNKYLLNPYKLGEVVKVQEACRQIPNHDYDNLFPKLTPTSNEFFAQRYCRILRKDKDGRFSHACAIEWDALELIKRSGK